EGDRLIVAIRPEKLLLSGERQGEGENSVQGVIETAAYLPQTMLNFKSSNLKNTSHTKIT
ncbi:MAG: hypothetical protein AAF503_12070, partial [Pseudomonadota bacterium]